MQSIATSASVATPRSQFRVLRRASCALDVAVVDAVVAAGIRAVVFDFDLCVLSIHSYGERLEPHHVLARAPLADDFVDLDFFRALVTALAARGVRVAIASFGRYDVIQTYLDRVFVRACESGSESAPGSSSNFFTRDTISTPTCVGGKDGAEVDGGKNPQLQKLAEFFKVLPSEMLFFDDSLPNIYRATKGSFKNAVHCPLGFNGDAWARAAAVLVRRAVLSHVAAITPPSLSFLLISSQTDASVPRSALRAAGAAAARHTASSLASCHVDDISWVRDSALSKPRAERASAPGSAVAAVNLSYSERAVVIASHPDARVNVGVDVISLSRAAAAAPTAPQLLGGALCASFCGAMPSRSLSPLNFAVRWTLAEALLKLRGVGLAVEDGARVALGGVIGSKDADVLRVGVCDDCAGEMGARVGALLAQKGAPDRLAIVGYEGVDWLAAVYFIVADGDTFICTVAWDSE